jgi:hypothetical protein
MASPPLTPYLHGLRLAVTDGAAALALFERVFAAPLAEPASPRDTARWPRLQLGGPWLELRATPGDTLDLRCEDLARQRTHLQRLGIEPIDGMALGCTPCLRLEAVDTGACTVDLREAAPASAHDTTPTRGVRLCSLTLSVRSPERVALHWAQLFHAPSGRDAHGLPALALGRFDLRFALASDGFSAVTGLDFSVDDMDAVLRDATSHGLSIRRQGTRHAAFDACGIRFVVRPVL